jgi:hypothetical protein
VSSRLLPSLNAGLSFYHYDRYLGDEKTFSSDNYSLYVKAAIYPDLSASLSTSYIISDTLRQVVDDDDLEGVFRNQKAFNSRMDVTAKLHRKLTGYLTYNYNIKDDEISGKAESANGIITLSYQPSDLLAMQGSYRAFFFDSTAPNVLSGSMELFLLRTSKSRLTLKAAYSQDDTQTINTFGMLGSWNISDYLSLTTSGNYFLGQDSFYSFNANLSMRL